MMPWEFSNGHGAINIHQVIRCSHNITKHPESNVWIHNQYCLVSAGDAPMPPPPVPKHFSKMLRKINDLLNASCIIKTNINHLCCYYAGLWPDLTHFCSGVHTHLQQRKWWCSDTRTKKKGRFSSEPLRAGNTAASTMVLMLEIKLDILLKGNK